MTGENPVSWLAQFIFINLYVYLETGLNRSTSYYCMKTSLNKFPEVNILTLLQYYPQDS